MRGVIIWMAALVFAGLVIYYLYDSGDLSEGAIANFFLWK
jgi:hypothetical protein